MVPIIGWTSHSFSDLVTSDAITMAVYDGANNEKLEFKLDFYLPVVPRHQGYDCLGVSGGDGSMIVGEPVRYHFSYFINGSTTTPTTMFDYGFA